MSGYNSLFNFSVPNPQHTKFDFIRNKIDDKNRL